jgi:hypothetical protein
MSQFTWVLLDADGGEMRSSESFESQADAEAWMGSNWEALLEEGAEHVSLRSGDEQVYKMGLKEA